MFHRSLFYSKAVPLRFPNLETLTKSIESCFWQYNLRTFFHINCISDRQGDEVVIFSISHVILIHHGLPRPVLWTRQASVNETWLHLLQNMEKPPPILWGHRCFFQERVPICEKKASIFYGRFTSITSNNTCLPVTVKYFAVLVPSLTRTRNV